MTTTTPLDPEACYRAVTGRDPRWDGRVYLAVLTTGIYCRPSCPARTPHQVNCRFYPTAAAAVAAGFRACKRCRPDALPGSRDWDVRADLAARAVRMVRDGIVDEVGVGGLAAQLGISERHLHRVMVAEVGVAPHQLNRTRRAQTARLLIEQTPLGLAEVAFAAGFASVRQFNEVMRAEFAVTPSLLRRPPLDGARPEGAGPVPSAVLRLRYRPPLALAALSRFLSAHAVPGLDRRDEPPSSLAHTRTVPAPHGPAVVTVGGDGIAPYLTARLRLADLADLAPTVARIRRWLDLDADPALVDGYLTGDPLLAPLVAARPGLRVPGAVDGTETAVLAVLGQQVSLAAAGTFAGRLVAAFGEPAADGLTAFPTADALATSGADQIRSATGITGSRARTLHALAAAVRDGLRLDPGADRTAARAALTALPGVGPWTVEYLALRALGDPDAFPAGDLVLRRALSVGSAAQAMARAQSWRPWRGYALMHLWTREVFA